MTRIRCPDCGRQPDTDVLYGQSLLCEHVYGKYRVCYVAQSRCVLVRLDNPSHTGMDLRIDRWERLGEATIDRLILFL
jgi:hypothetical protein